MGEMGFQTPLEAGCDWESICGRAEPPDTRAELPALGVQEELPGKWESEVILHPRY